MTSHVIVAPDFVIEASDFVIAASEPQSRPQQRPSGLARGDKEGQA